VGGERLAATARGIFMSFFEFRAINSPDHFIRHRNFLGELSFRSKNFPNLFLRHRDFRIRLEGSAGPNDQLFLRDSTFALVEGLADPERISFR
jgi:hypothetical protein